MLAVGHGQVYEVVQNLALPAAVRTAVPLAEHLDQFPSCCHAELRSHMSLQAAVSQVANT
jgi:hypothetical protein